MSTTKVIVALLAILILAQAAVPARHFPSHTRALRTKAGWSPLVLSSADKDSTLTTLYIFLQLRNEVWLEKKLEAVSDPDSKEYGQYATLDELKAQTSPLDSDVKQVVAWLNSVGIFQHELVPYGDMIKITPTLAQAEELLKVEYMRYVHRRSAKVAHKTLEPYSIPLHLASIVNVIAGVHELPRIQDEVKPFKAVSLERQWGMLGPSDIKSTFNMSTTARSQTTKNFQATANFLEQYIAPSDLATFQQTYNLPAQTVEKMIGPNDPTNPGVEASLDIQYMTALAPMVRTWFISTGGLVNGQEPFVEWATNLNSMTTLPFVHSVSYGDEEDTIPYAYTDRLNKELIKLGARGISILFASGDNGVGCNSAGTRFLPNWPATSPYVTSVGGFYSSNGLNSDSIASGGFSNYFVQPSYQKVLVNQYMQTSGLPAASFYNVTSRAFPDVSGYSENIGVFTGGFEQPVGGTSCAAPMFSGTVSMLNDYLLANNKPTLGFLNPLFYKWGAMTNGAFVDITVGDTNSYGNCVGFNPAVGWDPITGLGAPNYGNMLAALKTLHALE